MRSCCCQLGLALWMVIWIPSAAPAQSPTSSGASVATQPQSVPTARTSVHLEVLGNGGLYSINVERLLSDRLSARVGFGSWSSDDLFGAGEQSIIAFPVMASGLFGQGSSKLEVGAGFLLGRASFTSAFGEESDRSQAIVNLTTVVGYRYQRPAGGFLFRAGLTPMLALGGGDHPYPESGLFLSAGTSFGYSF